MPTPVAPYVSVFLSASDIPDRDIEALKSNERYTNTILPNLLDERERLLQGKLATPGQSWIVCRSPNSKLSVDLMLGCIENPLGSYPIFIVTTQPFTALTNEFLYPRLTVMVEALLRLVPTSRVFSIFSPAPITQVFADVWHRHTAIEAYHDEPYYDATVSYCTKSNLTSQPEAKLPAGYSYELRPGVEKDIHGIAELCWNFSQHSDPFTLTLERAYEEANVLIRRKQVWVHAVNQPNGVQAIASIVAITRSSTSVSVITKVVTHPDWRRRGCAERLVRRVSRHLLSTKEAVMLYVGRDNDAAHVYSRVGFPGLDKESHVEGVDHWLELGFDRNKVSLGHW
ncbi:hypothetical protein HGRIS_001877 [Hohenbuehelia grisea]|uniref:N-acetyltransferase domain-containing protein n=1 Tax=Hohenbuehelia grisea TaxID=104357 RepID=A0ABR3JIX3_9AGAR